MELKEYLELSTVPDFFFLWEVGTREISYLSPSFKKLKVEGLTKEDTVRELIHPDSVEYFNLVMEKLPELHYRIDEEIRANSEKYDIEWLRLKTFPFYKENAVYKVAIQFNFISKQKDKLTEIKKGEVGTQGMLKAVIQDFWGTFSNIIAFAKIMENEIKEQHFSDLEHYAANIIKIGFETKDVLETVLNLNEIEKGKQKLTLEKLELQLFIKETTEKLRNKFQKFHVGINFILPDTPVYINIDKMRISQVFDNLVFNLAKSTKAGQSINISGEHQEGKNILISICNFQKEPVAGLEIETQPELFPGYYIKPEHDIDSPSGLEITKKIIELHKGKIWMESKIGKGSIFFIELPID